MCEDWSSPVGEAMKERARVLEDLARTRMPVRTGDTLRSISATETHDENGVVMAKVSARYIDYFLEGATWNRSGPGRRSDHRHGRRRPRAPLKGAIDIFKTL
jgi:hypothetical protein